MHSLFNLEAYRKPQSGVYVLECFDGAIYVGSSGNLDCRLAEHARCGEGRVSSAFVHAHGGAKRVLELHFVPTRTEAFKAEYRIASEIYEKFKEVTVYHPSYHKRHSKQEVSQ